MVSFKDIEAYGNKICDLLKSRNHDAITIFSRESTIQALCEYFEFYKETDDKKGIMFNTNLEVEVWINKFRTYLSFYALEAFMDVDINPSTT